MNSNLNTSLKEITESEQKNFNNLHYFTYSDINRVS